MSIHLGKRFASLSTESFNVDFIEKSTGRKSKTIFASETTANRKAGELKILQIPSDIANEIPEHLRSATLKTKIIWLTKEENRRKYTLFIQEEGVLFGRCVASPTSQKKNTVVSIQPHGDIKTTKILDFIEEQVPLPHNLIKKDARQVWEILLRYMPEDVLRASSLNPGKGLLDFINTRTLPSWEYLRDLIRQLKSEDEIENDIFDRFRALIDIIDPLVENHLNMNGIEGLLRAITSQETVEICKDIIKLRVDWFNKKNGTSYKELEETLQHEGEEKFTSFVQSQLTKKTETNFVRRTLELMVLESYQGHFAQAVEKAILQVKAYQDGSPILELLELFIEDFIQSNQKSIWFNDQTNNFGYSRPPSAWEALLLSDPSAKAGSELSNETLIKASIESYLDNFEQILDIFYEKGMFSFSKNLVEFSNNLDWILTMPLETFKLLEQFTVRSRVSSKQLLDPNLVKVFQRAFLSWAIEEALSKIEYSPLSLSRRQDDRNEQFDEQEIKLRVDIAFAVMQLPDTERGPFISDLKKTNINVFHVGLQQEIELPINSLQSRICDGVKAVESASGLLIESRKIDSMAKVDLVLGFGFEGSIFSTETSVRGENKTKIYINVSQSGRVAPTEAKKISSSLFCIPMLHASRFLMQKKNRLFFEGAQEQDLIPIKILPAPRESDVTVHKFLSERILSHYLKNTTIPHHNSFFIAIKNELVNVILEATDAHVNKISKKTNNLKQRRPPDQKAIDGLQMEMDQKKALSEQLVDKFQQDAMPLLNDEEMQFLLMCLENKSSICVESVISRHSMNNVIIPICFNLNRTDVIKIDKKDVRIGKHNRPVIPPCDRYCQLFAGSHMLWAELNRNPSADLLNQVDLKKGGAGLTSLFGDDNQNS